MYSYKETKEFSSPPHLFQPHVSFPISLATSSPFPHHCSLSPLVEGSHHQKGKRYK